MSLTYRIHRDLHAGLPVLRTPTYWHGTAYSPAYLEGQLIGYINEAATNRQRARVDLVTGFFGDLTETKGA